MSARGPLQAVARRWPWLVAVLLTGLLAGAGHYVLSTPTYRASASVFFSLQFGNSASELVQGSTYAQNQVVSFARLATTPAVLEPVIDDLDLDVGPDELAGRIVATAPLDTVIIEVTVTDESAERSARIANAVAGGLADTVEDLAPQNAAGEPTVRAMTVASAEVPDEPAAPDLLLDLAAGLLAGLVLGCGVAWARDLLDTRVQDPAVVAALTDLPVVGTIGPFPPGTVSPVVVESAPHGPSAEAFRQLRTNLQFLEIPEVDGERGGVRTLMVTSSVPNEGKSTTAANLAVTLADTGARVLLVDTDLRRPSVARLLGLEGAAGLTTVLLGRASVEDVVQEWGSSGLWVLPSGQVPPNPSELLSSPAMRRLVQQLRDGFDYVVLDAPPLLPVADAAILSHVVDGTFLVVDVRRVRRHELRESLQGLEHVNSRPLGLVLNQVRRNESSYSYSREDDPGHAARLNEVVSATRAEDAAGPLVAVVEDGAGAAGRSW